MGRKGISLLVPVERIERRILFLRGHRVMLDVDLAEIYGVTTKRLNEQVKRNRERFPEDFVFRLHRAEAAALNRSQTATGSQKHRDPRFRPYAFTEHGAVMLASVLNRPVTSSPARPRAGASTVTERPKTGSAELPQGRDVS